MIQKTFDEYLLIGKRLEDKEITITTRCSVCDHNVVVVREVDPVVNRRRHQGLVCPNCNSDINVEITLVLKIEGKITFKKKEKP